MTLLSPLSELLDRGGPVMFALLALSLVLYLRCFDLLLYLHRARGTLSRGLPASPLALEWLDRQREEWSTHFRQQRGTLAAMIAAAPLLGLLGTVNGMISIFASLSADKGARSMEGLASGISEVLVATESGLAVAIPAMLIVYYAHRQTMKGMNQLHALETTLRAQLRAAQS